MINIYYELYYFSIINIIFSFDNTPNCLFCFRFLFFYKDRYSTLSYFFISLEYECHFNPLFFCWSSIIIVFVSLSIGFYQCISHVTIFPFEQCSYIFVLFFSLFFIFLKHLLCISHFIPVHNFSSLSHVSTEPVYICFEASGYF